MTLKPVLIFLLMTSVSVAGAQTSDQPTAQDWVEACADWDKWDKPGPPFKLVGNSYYVGTCGIAAILITGNEGHILIDSGTEIGARIVQDNISRLGYNLNDVKILLHSHEHFDHVGGLASLQLLSGARLYASPAAATVLRTGIAGKGDPQAGALEPFAPARVDGEVEDGGRVVLGNLQLTALATPGHTPGALSWHWQSCEADQCVSLVYADSLSPVSAASYRFSEHPDYLQAYRQSLVSLAGLPCELLLTPHPSASRMRQRLSDQNTLRDDQACTDYAAAIEAKLAQRLLSEQSE